VENQVRFNRVPKKVPKKVWEVQGSGEGSGEGLGGFSGEGSGEGSGMLWCRARSGSTGVSNAWLRSTLQKDL